MDRYTICRHRNKGEDLFNMTTAAITILGLGPGSMGDLTLEAQSVLDQAARDHRAVYLRTTLQPIVEALLQRFPRLQIESFDRLYDESADWAALYPQIAQEICDVATKRPVIYAVPGHPLVGEASVQLLLRVARERNLSVAIVAGLSFLEPVYTALQLDPFESGAQLVHA